MSWHVDANERLHCCGVNLILVGITTRSPEFTTRSCPFSVEDLSKQEVVSRPLSMTSIVPVSLAKTVHKYVKCLLPSRSCGNPHHHALYQSQCHLDEGVIADSDVTLLAPRWVPRFVVAVPAVRATFIVVTIGKDAMVNRSAHCEHTCLVPLQRVLRPWSIVRHIAVSTPVLYHSREYCVIQSTDTANTCVHDHNFRFRLPAARKMKGSPASSVFRTRQIVPTAETSGQESTDQLTMT